jgi:regulatory protein
MAKPDAFELAVGALGRKERTTAELTAWLGERGVEADEVVATIERLVEIGELDDERFARRYADDKRELRGWGAVRIREALIARGVPTELAELAAGSESHGAQLERAAELLSRNGLDAASEPARARALAFLTRRGYDYEIAYEAVRRREREAA